MRSSGEEQLKKLIRDNLQDCDNDNPFQQDLGLGSKHIFSAPSDDYQSELALTIKLLFQRLALQLRAQLDEVPKFTRDGGDLIAHIVYTNLEENKPGQVLRIVKTASGAMAVE